MPLTVRRVLYCTDLSPSADHAFGYALFLAATAGAEIRVLHVVEKLSTDTKIALESYILDPAQRRRAVGQRVQTARRLVEAWQDDFWSQQDEATLKLKPKIAAVDARRADPQHLPRQGLRSHPHGCPRARPRPHLPRQRRQERPAPLTRAGHGRAFAGLGRFARADVGAKGRNLLKSLVRPPRTRTGNPLIKSQGVIS